MVMSQICGIAGFYLFDHLLKNNATKPWIVNVILIIFMAISFFAVLFLDNNLPRYDIDKAGKIKEEEDKHSDEDVVKEVKVEIK